eukprot:362638-Chlamydomonas_euryale.AAC.6
MLLQLPRCLTRATRVTLARPRHASTAHAPHVRRPATRPAALQCAGGGRAATTGRKRGAMRAAAPRPQHHVLGPRRHRGLRAACERRRGTLPDRDRPARGGRRGAQRRRETARHTSLCSSCRPGALMRR